MTEPLTPTQIENRLTASLSTISTLWDEMLAPLIEPAAWRPKGGQTTAPKATKPGEWPARPTRGRQGHAPAGALRDDDDASNADMPRTDQVISIRTEVMRTLRSWCQVVVEDHDVEHGIPSGVDVPGMVAFLERWAPRMAEHQAGADLLDELDDCATAVRRCARPDRDTSMYLGECPTIHTDPDSGEGVQCRGSVRTLDPSQSRYPTEDAEARCKRCGTTAVVTWWDQQMNPDSTRGGEGWADRTLTADEVVTLARTDYGRPLTRAAIRKWVSREWLDPVGDDVPHRYRLGDVVLILSGTRSTA